MRCDISINRCDASKRLEVIAYTGNQSFDYGVHKTKQTLEKRLLVDITAIREMVEGNEINITWIKEEKQMGDTLTESGASSKI